LTLPAQVLAWAAVFWAGPLAAQESEKTREPGTTRWLDTVVVSATRTDESLRDLPISPVVIDQETIARQPNTDLGRLLESAGIVVDRQSPEGGQVMIRGMLGNLIGSDVQSNILMLFNGHRIGTSNMLRFPSKNIERIEVVRGPAGLQYGSAAMGGVVNVITKRGRGDFSGYAESGLGSFGKYDLNLGFSGATENGFDYSFGYYQMEQSKDFEVGGGETYKGTGGDLKVESSANLGYTFNEKHRLGLIYNYLEVQDYGFPGTIASTRPSTLRPTDPGYIPPSQFLRTGGQSYFADLSYEGASETDRFNWRANYFTGRDHTIGQVQPFVNDINGASAQLTGNFDEINTSVTLGFDWTDYDFTEHARIKTMNGYQYQDMGGFLMTNVKFLEDRLVFSGGGRLNYYKNETSDDGGHQFSDTVFTPSFGVSYMAADCLKIRSNYAQGYRAPAAPEMYGEGRHMPGRYSFMGGRYNAVWLVPNYDLKPQKIDSVELGLDVEKDGFTGSLTAFYAKYKNKIERGETQPPPWPGGLPGVPPMLNGLPVFFPTGDPGTPFVGIAQYINFSDARTAGLEWALRWDAGQTYDWGFTLAPYSRGTYLLQNEYKGGEFDGKKMAKTPDYYVSNGLELELPDQGLWVDFNVLTKGRQRAGLMTTVVDPNEWQSGWSTANLRVKKELGEIYDRGRVSLQGELLNVFDKYYEPYDGYPQPGRAFYLGLRLDYN
jgi:vitamin B12 transporter